MILLLCNWTAQVGIQITQKILSTSIHIKNSIEMDLFQITLTCRNLNLEIVRNPSGLIYTFTFQVC